MKLKEIISVIALEKDRVVFSGMFLDKWQAKPIPITEEWLLKFGYKKVNTLYDITEVFEKKLSYTIYFRNGVLSFSFGTMEIKYINQLQNIFYFLTGEELTLKQ